EVHRVGGEAVAGHLGVDLRAARLRMLELFEYEHRAGLAHHEAVTLRVERTRGVVRIVVPARKRAHGAETGDPHLAHGRLRAAAEHHVRATESDRVAAVADGHVRGGTCRALGEKRPTRAELDR